MNIQIFGTSKSFDTKKAERWFKERRIKYQFIDMKRYGLSGKEFDSVLRAVGGVDKLVDWEGKDPDLDLLRYLGSETAKEDKVYENQNLIRLPVVRNGKLATVGFAPDTWILWEEQK
ncbi:MAG: ArsC family transcriptional regulator [Oscillospiraceae bacterium]|nr:ArsC family transcriptional regulator [Oscillospiraceae bacterium]